MNYVAVSDVLQMSPSAVAPGLAADNCVCVLYFLALFAFARIWGESSETDSEQQQQEVSSEKELANKDQRSFITE